MYNLGHAVLIDDLQGSLVSFVCCGLKNLVLDRNGIPIGNLVKKYVVVSFRSCGHNLS